MLWPEENNTSDLPRTAIKDDFDEVRFMPWCSQFKTVTEQEKVLISGILSELGWNIRSHEEYKKNYGSPYDMLSEFQVRRYFKRKYKNNTRRLKGIPKVVKNGIWKNYIFLINEAKKIIGPLVLEGGGGDMFGEDMDINEAEEEADQLFDRILRDKLAKEEGGEITGEENIE